MYAINPHATTAQVLTAFNDFADKPRKAFKNKADAFAALQALIDDGTVSHVVDDVVSEVSDKKKPGRRTDLTNAVIAVVGANPARPRTVRFDRYALLADMDGKTVEDYYAACRDAGIPCSKNNPVNAVAKGFITLTAQTGELLTFAA